MMSYPFIRLVAAAAFILSFLGAAAPAYPAGAESANSGENIPALVIRSDQTSLQLSGFLQLWWIMMEGTENALHHPQTGESADQYSSGFSIRRARLATVVETPRFKARMSLKLETASPALRDAYLDCQLYGDGLRLRVGQMKIPSTYEIGVPAKKLDFLSRSWFSKNVVDYSLCRSPLGGNPDFVGTGVANRDIGIALLGDLNGRRLGGEYYALIGNGFGANRFPGGNSNEQEIYGNDFGDYLYALRVSFGSSNRTPPDGGKPSPASLRFGGHVSYNTHSNIVLGDRATVMDIERLAWSGDVRIQLLGTLKLTGMYGQVRVDDDFVRDGRTDYALTGWELKAVADIIPGTFQPGFRYDAMSEQYDDCGPRHRLDAYTLGLNYFLSAHSKVQINYMWNLTDSPRHSDLDDDFFAGCVQILF